MAETVSRRHKTNSEKEAAHRRMCRFRYSALGSGALSWTAAGEAAWAGSPSCKYNSSQVCWAKGGVP